MLRLTLLLVCLVLPASAERLRVATWNVEMDRRGPGLLLRDILKGEDAQVAAVIAGIAALDADVLLLTRFDWDHGQAALEAFAARLAEAGAPYPHRFTLRPNAGVATGLDLDGDGRTGQGRDRQGYGRYMGQNGMAVLSRLPIDAAAAVDLSGLLWRDLPGARLPRRADGGVFPSEAAMAVQRLSSTGHWDVPVILSGGGRLHLLAFHATPPVFDGPEDRNGLRGQDELRLWTAYLDGALAWPPPEGPFVVLGNSNIDPAGGDGRRDAMAAFLADPRLRDPRPESPGAAAGGFRAPALARFDTAAWDAAGEPGNLRVDYVLPSADLTILDAGVMWPAPGAEADALLGVDGRTASRHRPVWVDLLASPEPEPEPAPPPAD